MTKFLCISLFFIFLSLTFVLCEVSNDPHYLNGQHNENYQHDQDELDDEKREQSKTGIIRHAILYVILLCF